MFKCWPVQKVAMVCGAKSAVICRCRFSAEHLGKRFLKAYKLYGGPWIVGLAALCRCPGRRHSKLVSNDGKRKGSSKPKVTGEKLLLKNSAHYPRAMGVWIVDKWLIARRTPSQSPVSCPPPASSSWKDLELSSETISERRDARSQVVEQVSNNSDWRILDI